MDKAYTSIFNHAPDFEVTYRLFSAEEGGRKTPPYQGIRWDFMYDEYRDGLYIIHPKIINTSTEEVYESGIPIPPFGKATMYILNPEFRPLHRQRIKAGTRGYFMEGSRQITVCEVTRILGLYDNPIKR